MTGERRYYVGWSFRGGPYGPRGEYAVKVITCGHKHRSVRTATHCAAKLDHHNVGRWPGGGGLDNDEKEQCGEAQAELYRARRCRTCGQEIRR